jgi:Tol biopolymer transport system component
MEDQWSANLWRIEVGESNEQQLTYETEGWWITSFDIPPGGDRIAYTPYKGAGANALIKLVELHDNTLTVITGENDPGLEDDVAWLDDHRITYRINGYAGDYESKESSDWQAYWHDIDLDQASVLDLSTGERSDYPEYNYITQSPDKDYWLTCNTEHYEAPCEYQLHHIDSQQQWPVAENIGWGQFIAWAPDSQQLLFNAYQRTNPAIYLVLVDRETRQARNITPEDQMVTSASWSPDGQRIAYNLCVDQQNCSLWLIKREGDQPQRIPLDLPIRAYTLGWSPDGSRLVFASDPDKADLWSVRIDGTDLRPIARNVVDCRVLPGD